MKQMSIAEAIVTHALMLTNALWLGTAQVVFALTVYARHQPVVTKLRMAMKQTLIAAVIVTHALMLVIVL